MLEREAGAIIQRSLVRSTLVQPNNAITSVPELGARFEHAVALYRAKAFREAQAEFSALADTADAERPNAGLTARLNAAACAAESRDWVMVVELLKPQFQGGHLYGHPLWNLAMAWYHQGHIDEALSAFEKWASMAQEWHQARGLLLIAAITLKRGDRRRAEETLQRAAAADAAYVADQLQSSAFPLASDRPAANGARPSSAVTAGDQDRLRLLVQPRRPERRPELSILLTADEMEVFTSAIEEIAEARYQHAKTRLSLLFDKHPNVQEVKFAIAACELFGGNYVKARDILLPATASGARMPGSALWNLACAQIRLGDFAGARDALIRCSDTEYRTKGQLWTALGVLTPAAAGRSPGGASGKQIPPRAESSAAPRTTTERRRFHLERLIRPRKITPSYKPDINKLTLRDRQTVDQLLRDAHKADPPNAHSMLVPWISRYPGIYTLKVHGAAFALFAGAMQEASRLLREASEIRPLDPVSRMNLASVCLKHDEYSGIVTALEGGENYAMGETSDYWLALAVARAASQQGDASAAAAHAVALSPNEASRKALLAMLAEVEITPAQGVSVENPAMAAARQAQEMLARGDVAGAADRLNHACGSQFEFVGEIGPRVFDPQCERVPDQKWNHKLTAGFNKALTLYEEGSAQEAVEEWRRLLESGVRTRIAANLLAALLKTGARQKAATIARGLLPGMRFVSWRFYYNQALSQPKDRNAAVILERKLRDSPRGQALLAAICRANIDKPFLATKLVPALERLQRTTVQPSLELLLALAWAQLQGPNPSLEKCQTYLHQVLARTGLQALIPPAEANSMAQVRAAYAQLVQGGKREDATQYLNRIIETKEAERSEHPGRNIERNVGVEFAARECLVAEYHTQNMREQAIQILDQCEALLSTYAEAMSPGFLARDWQSISELSLRLGLPFAGLRRVNAGLKIDPESNELKEIRLTIEASINTEELALLDACMARLASLAHCPSSPVECVGDLSRNLDTADLLKLRAPSTYKSLADLLSGIVKLGDGDFETEEKTERIILFGKAELPQGAIEQLEGLLSWIVETFAKEQPGNPVDVEIHDDKLWPSSYESEACGLIVINPLSQDPCTAAIYDRQSNKCVWDGPLQPGSPVYKRWVFDREDGFLADEQVDLPFLIRVSQPDTVPEYTVTLNASVASGDAVWPDYPTGALDPKDIPGGELYGRSAFIKRIVNSVGQSRAQATYLIEGVRQMGKTSLLKFIKQHAPRHVLPIYINLEAIQSDPEKNVWNVIIEQILRDEQAAAHLPAQQAIQGKRHGDLVTLAKQLCAATGKSYLLLLMDELHVLLRESGNAKGILADLRTDLNEASNRISVVLADRYTLEESEKKVDSEYWLQLTPQPLEPLDYASTKSAIEVPCQGTDIRFLPEAIDRIYYWTYGYPFHVQRLVQNVLANNLAGPWVTVVAGDVESAVPGLLSQDRLFQEGLCRKDRMDRSLQAAIAAVLEWSDLRELFPELSEDAEWREVLNQWEPQVAELIAGLGDPDELLNRLTAVGVMRREAGRAKFFSPLLERWLHKMRDESRSLLDTRGEGNWGLSPDEEVARLRADEWMRLDSELQGKCQRAGVPPPLKSRAASLDSWETLTRAVANREEFMLFLSKGHELLIDGREEKQAMLKYPWLTLGYHRLRLVRNALVHGSAKPSAVAAKAWDQVYFRGVGRQRNGGEPNGSDEWRAVQLVLLRAFHIGFRNAIAIAGDNGGPVASRG